jgi:signal transduction histidine kinase
MKDLRAIRTLTPNEFLEAFPFHICFDIDLKIKGLGRVLERYIPNKNQNSNLEDLVDGFHPEGKLNLEVIKSHKGKLFIFRFKWSPFLLRGQLIERNENGEFLFLGSPWLTASEDLLKYNLTMNDFALFDPIVDLLQLGQAKEMAAQDIEKLAENLKLKSSELEKANSFLKENNLQLVAAKEAAESATKAKSEFLARMSHEIRTPMHGMLSMIDILNQKALEPESREYLQIMKDSSVSLLTIINDILDL